MSKRRIAALGAVIIVPIAVLAIVLGSLLDDGNSGGNTAEKTQPPTSPAGGGAPA
jgi:hypothetical protein